MQEVRLFLDSNVILSGLISSQGNPRIILDLLSCKVPALTGITGAYNVEEIERNLRKKFPELWPLYQEYFPKMNLKIVPLPLFEEVKPLLGKMSPKDVPVLVSAKLGKADYLVTGNKKDFPKYLMGSLQLVNPSEFLVRFAALIQT